MEFVWEKLSYVNNVLIYPGVYKAEREGGGYALENKKGQIVHIEEDVLFFYGYFCPVKYYFSENQKRIQQKHKSYFSYVLMNGVWTEYTEIIHGNTMPNFDGSFLLGESLTDLPTIYSKKPIDKEERQIISIIHFSNNDLIENEFRNTTK